MKSSRHQSRFIAIQALANYLFTNMDDSLETVLGIQHAENIDTDYLQTLYQQTLSMLASLKPLIVNTIKKNFDHLDYILQSVLYLATYELTVTKLDIGIVINEYVTLTKRFVDDLDYKLVHKVIHDINQNQRIVHASQATEVTGITTMAESNIVM